MSKLLEQWQKTNLMEAVFDHLSDALIIYDNRRSITGVNRAAERLFGMTADEMVGRECSEVFRCGQCEPGCGVLISLDHGHTPNGTIRLHTDNGRERLAVIRTSPIFTDDGQLVGSVATVRDVTDEVEPQRREVIGESPVMQELMRFVRRVAASEASTILIEGENGTGKDLIAKTLHYQSLRQAEPFIAINCAAIPETLLESELFGYEKGAFTDARQQKRGIFELADHGTLFLDEIGEIPLVLQAKLLRVLEEQNFRRLGGLKDIQVDLRVIAATNKGLREAVREGAFRQDLYFRLNVIHIQIPPLRERLEDIVPLARFFVEHYNKKFKRQLDGITPDAARVLMAHDWPGNVRELRNAIERAMILEETPRITPASLPLSLSHAPQHVAYAAAANGLPEPLGISSAAAAATASPVPVATASPEFGLSLEENERRLVQMALEKTNGNQTQAAKLLQVTRDTLRYKMKKYGLH
ncbi:MAG: sigma 54-interacting transcriptional regulator [Bryobacterales bacterium]|nr:sigma 54-interacting transcriptional regulator [Bryobacterales bacterium]